MQIEVAFSQLSSSKEWKLADDHADLSSKIKAVAKKNRIDINEFVQYINDRTGRL
jgi:hypothetical protein